MALDFMHDEMLKQLMKNSASHVAIDKYEIVWASAMRNISLPIPCPTCFIKGSISRLSPLRDEGGVSSARCVGCKTKFEWPSAE